MRAIAAAAAILEDIASLETRIFPVVHSEHFFSRVEAWGKSCVDAEAVQAHAQLRHPSLSAAMVEGPVRFASRGFQTVELREQARRICAATTYKQSIPGNARQLLSPCWLSKHNPPALIQSGRAVGLPSRKHQTTSLSNDGVTWPQRCCSSAGAHGGSEQSYPLRKWFLLCRGR